MRKKVKFLGIFMLILITSAYSCNEVTLDKRPNKEVQAKIDSCTVKITDYVFSEICNFSVEQISLKSKKIKVITNDYGRKRKILYNIYKVGKDISLEVKLGYMNFTTVLSTKPWMTVPNIEIHDMDSIYLVSIRSVLLGFSEKEAYAEKYFMENIPFDKNGNIIKSTSERWISHKKSTPVLCWSLFII